MLPLLEKINWSRPGYDNFDIYRHDSPGDGHCLIHSVAFSVYLPYRTGKLYGKSVSQDSIVKKFREDMAKRLEKIDVKTGKKFYDTVGNGNLASLGKADPEYYSLDSLKKLLLSSKNLGPEIIIVLEHLIKVNIYILDERHVDVVTRDESNNYQKSIVVYYSHHHYTPVSRRVGNQGIHVTLFKENDSFIAFLRKRLETRPKNYAENLTL